MYGFAIMHTGSHATKDMAQKSSSSHQEPDAATAVTESVTVADKIEQLEVRFSRLQEQFVTELQASAVPTSRLLHCLTLLPISLKKEYETSIHSVLPVLTNTVDNTTNFMIRLNPLMSFLDYGLLAYLIRRFGSEDLVRSMDAYKSDMRIFMKVTTLADLVDFLPGQCEEPPRFALLMAKFDRDPRFYTLEKLDMLRRRFCSDLRLSEIVFHLISIEPCN